MVKHTVKPVNITYYPGLSLNPSNLHPIDPSNHLDPDH
jgi:hypothetical protein